MWHVSKQEHLGDFVNDRSLCLGFPPCGAELSKWRSSCGRRDGVTAFSSKEPHQGSPASCLLPLASHFHAGESLLLTERGSCGA